MNLNRSNNIQEFKVEETNTFILNSSFKSGSNNSSKQIKTLKDNMKNCKSQRKIPGWMQENEVSSELIGIKVNNSSQFKNNKVEDYSDFNINQKILNQDKFTSQNNQENEENLGLHELADNNLRLTRLSKNKNEFRKINNPLNLSLEKAHYYFNIKEKSKIISSPFLEKNENNPIPYMSSQPSLSSESNFEYHKKHNILQNIFLKNQINQGYMSRPYIQSKFAIDNRISNPYIDQSPKPNIGINSLFKEEPIGSRNFNSFVNNEKMKEKDTDILDDFVKNHSLQSNPS